MIDQFKPSICNRERAEQTWFYIPEDDKGEVSELLNYF